MNIDEAIEMLKRPNFGATWPLARLEIKAIQLGVEALERIKSIRNTHYGQFRKDITDKLPSEKEEK